MAEGTEPVADVFTSEFIVSNTSVDQCPEPDLPEYALIGRSNVGKSSLINKITGQKHLAKVSVTPGKTQLINHFLINKDRDPWYMVDLPGYGFAKVPVKEKERWLRFIRQYLKERENLMCVLVLLDARHNAQKVDLDFMRWLGENGIPFVMVFTKLDKLKPGEWPMKFKAYERKMLEEWNALPQVFATSSETGAGRQELLDWVQATNRLFYGEA